MRFDVSSTALLSRLQSILVISFDAFGHVVVDHIGYIGFVDPHTESVGGYHEVGRAHLNSSHWW